MSSDTPGIAISPRAPVLPNVGAYLVALLTGVLFPRRLSERFVGLSAEQRKPIAALIERAQKSLSAADALVPLGHEKEALELLIQARDATNEAIALAGAAALPEPGRRALSAAAEALVREAEEPHDFDEVRSAIVASLRSIEGLAWSAREARRATIERRFAVLATALVVIVTLVAARSVMRAPKVTASALYGATFAPEMVLDGDAATDWLLPDRTAGHLDVHVHPARHIEQLRLVNGRNAPHNDRGTREYTIEVYLGAEKLSTQTGSFSTPGLNEVRDVPIHAKADRIRVVVTSFFGTGGGLADVKLN